MINAARGWAQEGGLIDVLAYPNHIHARRDVFMESKTQLETSTLWDRVGVGIAILFPSTAIEGPA